MNRSQKMRRKRLETAKPFLQGLLGIALSLVALFALVGLVSSIIYLIVVGFLVLIFLSNFTAKMFVAYFHHRERVTR